MVGNIFPLRYPLALVLKSASLGLPESLAGMGLSNLANNPPTKSLSVSVTPWTTIRYLTTQMP
jgi:hypothetical protein